MIFTIFVFILVLSLLVFVHEFGHFWVAKKMGMIPKEFGFGFPPRAWGIYKATDGTWKKVRGGKEVTDAKGTIYSLNWLPLGGFVNLSEDEDGGDDEHHFNNKKPWQRATILMAGVIMNIIFAGVLISIGYMFGFPQATSNLGSNAIVSDEKIQIVEVIPESPAALAGIKSRDVIKSIDGTVFSKIEDLQKYVDARVGENLDYKIIRDQKEIDFTITPVMIEESGHGGVGISIIKVGLVRYNVFIAVWEGFKSAFILTWRILVAFYLLIKGLFAGEAVGAAVAGPVGIAVITGQYARLGLVYLMQFSALLSINLAIINALPFPALDGGRVLFIFIEKIKGSPVRKEIEAIIHNVGFALLMLLVLFVTYKDVIRYGGNLWQRIFG